MIGGLYVCFLYRSFLEGFCWTDQKVGKKIHVDLTSKSFMWLRSSLKPSSDPEP